MKNEEHMREKLTAMGKEKPSYAHPWQTLEDLDKKMVDLRGILADKRDADIELLEAVVKLVGSK